jgi:adenosylcobinamide-GDP ribazoletransferase
MFYTRLPVPAGQEHSDLILNRSRKYFPLIGIIVGLISASAYCLASLVLPVSISVLLSMVCGIMATGAFHEDGFADSCDGFGGGWTKEQVLTIMKDSRLGTYGCTGLISILSIKFAALLSLAEHGLVVFLIACVASHSLSRGYSSSVIELFDYVQDIDLSKVKPITDRSLGVTDLAVSLVTSLIVVMLLLVLNPIAGLLSIILAGFISYCFAQYSKKRIGGYTGDVLGAIQQLGEVTIYLCLVAML